MAIIIGGHETGLLGTSLFQLDRDDRTSKSNPGDQEQIHVNVSNGNMVFTQQDTFLPSRGADFELTRTYNSRGSSSDSQIDDARWATTTLVRLNERNTGGETFFEVTYGDGGVFEYWLDPESGQYVSTDGLGAYETLVVGDNKDDYAFLLTRADQTQLYFDKLGYLQRSVDTNGVATEYTYKSNRVVEIRDDEGHILTYSYTSGKLASVEDEKGNTLVQYRYSSGQLSEVEDRYGHVTRYFYTSDGFVNRIELPSRQRVDGQREKYESREIRFEYVDVNWSGTTSGNTKLLTRLIDAEGNATTFDYDFIDGKGINGGTTRVTDALGNTMTYAYDGDGRITSVVDQAGFHTSYQYDAEGNLLSVTDANGWGASNSNSDYYRDLRQSLGYASMQGDLSTSDKNELLAAFRSHFSYDERGNLLTATDNSGNTTGYTYTSFNKLATITSANGGVTILSYDANQNLVEQVDPGGDITRWTYDIYGNPTSRTVYLDPSDLNDPAKQQVTSYGYDMWGNNTSIVDGEGNVTSNSFDHFGNLTQSVDGNGGVTQYTYDADNRVLTVTDPEGSTTLNTYDPVGNRISFTDAKGKTVTYIYDRNNQLLATIDPSVDVNLTRESTRQYDAVGNVVLEQDAEGRQTSYSYNARRELVEVISTQVKGVDGSTDLQYTRTFAYDGEGSTVRSVDYNGNTTKFLYQQDGLLQQETNAIGHVTRYFYDANRNLLNIIAGAQLAPNKQQKLSFAYDDEDQIITSTDADGNVTQYGYDAPGTIASITDANGHVTDYEYDFNNRLIREVRPELPGVSPRYAVEYRLDGNGNIVETTDENGNSTLFAFDLNDQVVEITDANGIVTTFSYDPNRNLTRVEIGDGEPGAQVTSYIYDEFDQVIAEIDGVGHALASSDETLYQDLRLDLGYAALAADLSNADRQALRDLYTERYSYDRVGNMLSMQDNLGRITGYQYDNLDRLVLRTDALGNTRSYRYDGNGNLLSETDELGRQRSYVFDALDRITTQTDPKGSVTNYTYDEFDNLTSITEAAGQGIERVRSFEYDLKNLMIAETDPGNHKIVYEYDAVGNRVKVTDARGNSTDYIYDALNRNISVIDPLSFETRYEYDGVGNLLKIIDPLNNETSFSFDPGNRLISSVDAEGRELTFEYDVLGNSITQTLAAGTAAEQVTRYEYDAENNLRAIVDAEGKRISYEFDAAYNETAAIDANGNALSSQFDALNRVVRVTNALSGETSFSYDAVGNILSETDPLGRTTSYRYDDDDQLLVVTDPAGVETHYVNNVFGNTSITRAANVAGEERTRNFVYDKDDFLLSEVDELGHTKTYEYDENHNVSRVTDENGHSTRYVYDANNQLTELIDPLGNATRFEYDGAGNRVRTTNALGDATTSYFNGNNELVLQVDPLGYAVSFTYDDVGNLASDTRHASAVSVPVAIDTMPAVPTGSEDRTTSYSYDLLNRLVSQTDAEGHTRSMGYDAVGNQTSLTDERGNTTTYRYDVLDRLELITDSLGGERSYTYDAIGKQLSETDENGHTTRFEYDIQENLVKRIDSLGGERLYSYDSVGNQLSVTDEEGRTTGFVYDKLDRVVEQVNAAGDSAFFVYDAVGNQTSYTDENGDTSNTVYDAGDRVTSYTDAEGNTQQFRYDAFNNEIERIDEEGFSTLMAYDAMGRLILRTDAEGGVRGLSYDAVGNIVREVDESGRDTNYEFDGNNRLTAIIDALGETYEYTYDAAGNKISETDERGHTTSFSYDALNRLESQTDPMGGTQSLSYDAVGNEIRLEDEKGNTAAIEYDANNRIVAFLSAEGYLTTFEYDKVGNETLRRDYNDQYSLNGNGSIPAPGVGDAPRVTSSAYDVLSRLTSQTDATGLTTHYEYDPAGNPTRMYQGTPAPLAAGVAVAAAPAPAGGTPGEEIVTYDKRGRVRTRTDALGVETRYEYDRKGNVTRVTEAHGTPDARVTDYTYDRLGRRITETNALGITITYAYDKSDRLLSRTTAGDGSIGDRVERFEYDEVGRVSAEINGVGSRTEYEYDESGNVTRTTYGAGSSAQYSVSFEYDDNDRQTAEVDGDGIRTEYEYDLNGNKTRTVQVEGVNGQERTTNYEYDDENRLTAIVDPEGGRTTYQYDSRGNQYRITDANGTVTVNTFDDFGRILTNTVGVSQAHGGILTTNTYDDRGNVTSTAVQYADNSDTARVTRYEYDALDRIVKVTDPEGFASTVTYDVFGNQIEVVVGAYDGTDPDKIALAAPQATTFEYDDGDRLIRTIDGEGNAVVSTYDSHGNRTSQISGVATSASNDAAREGTLTYKYDLDGQMIEKSSDAGGRVVITRNTLGQQTRVSTLQSSGPEVWSTESYEYDAQGRVTTETDSYGVASTYTYDGVGNLLTISESGGRVTRYTYDLNSNNTSVTDAEGAATRYEYDAMGNMVKATDAEGGVKRLYFDGLNRLVAAADAEGYFTDFELDSAGNTLVSTVYATAVTVPSNGSLPTPVANTADRVVTQTFNGNNKRTSETAANGSVNTYVYDSAGRLLSQTQDVSGVDSTILARTADTTAKVLSWEWDAAGRLVKFTNVDGVTETYTYDAAGNKVSELVQDPNPLATTGAVDMDRLTTFTYDSSNRLLTQTTGSNVQTLGYDLAGNVVTKADALGNVTTTGYDRNNRVVSVTDALGREIRYAYDGVGNLTTTTDARGNTITLGYDLVNRVISETAPSTTRYTIDGGEVTGTTTAYNTWDDVGNLIERTDDAGNKTTTWYDGNGNAIAVVNPDLRLQRFSYNAFGELVTLTTDKNRLPDLSASRDPDSVPVGSGNTTTISNYYDTMGNLVRTVYPSIDITTVTGTGASASGSTVSQATEERSAFDAFNNMVQSTDRNGANSYAYYDARGRQIALVDGAGYLIESAYDSLGNVVQQRKYETAVSAAPGTLPTPPPGTVHTVDRYYDAQGQLVREDSPTVNTTGGGVRVTTSFSYDLAGRLNVKTRASGQTEAQTEHYYYDAAGQRTGVVTSNRTLNTFSYDNNGNLINQTRYINRVSDAVDLGSASIGSLVSGISTSATGDQETSYQFNAVNLLTKQTDKMGSGTGDDVVTEFTYDEVANLTRKKDAEGNFSYLAYDAGNRITQTIAPNGGHSFVEYNINGLKVRAWTGGAEGSNAPQVINSSIGGSVSNGGSVALTVNWDLPSSAGDVVSWVAWDTTAHTNLGPDDVPSNSPNQGATYANGSAASGSGTSRAVDIPLDSLNPGETVYFRVMVRDSANNQSWSEERSLEVPSTLSEIDIQQVGGDFVVEASFDSSVSSPVITSSSLGSDVAMTLVSGNTWRATLTGVTDPSSFSMGFTWGSGGNTYATSEANLLYAPEATKDPLNGTISWKLPVDGVNFVGDTQMLVIDGQPVPDEEANRVVDTLQYTPAAGSHNYDLYYGERVLEAHSLSIGHEDTQTLTATFNSYNTNDDGDIVSTNWDMSWVGDNDDLVQTSVGVTLSSAENARVSGDVMLAYRTASNDGEFTDQVAMVASGDSWSSTLDLAESGVYDLKIYYVDANGDEVIVEWRRVTVPAESSTAIADPASVTVAGEDVEPDNVGDTRAEAVGSALLETDLYSLTVLAAERGGSFNDSANVTEGAYTGPVDPSALVISLGLTDTGGAEGGKTANGLDDKTYFTRIEYNDLGMKVGSNEDTGQWRTYGVDANGNRVMTRLYGSEDESLSSIDTFAAFDARGLEVSATGPEVDGVAAVTTTAYNYDGMVVSLLEPGDTNASTFSYDGVGNLVSQTDAEGHTTSYSYDLLGNLVQVVDPMGHTRVMVYTYTGKNANRLTSSYYAGISGTTTEAYDYDAFGRRLSVTDGLGYSTSVAYDQRDRVTQVTDGGGHITYYHYDKRDNQTWIEDANGNFFGRAYNEMGLLTHEYAFVSSPGSLSSAISQAEAGGSNAIIKETVYDVFNNKIATIDAEGRSQYFTYGAFGRIASAFGIAYTYDRFGRQEREQNNSGRDIHRSYDDAGRLTQIDDRGINTKTDYTYDVAGNKLTEVLQVDGTVQRSQSYVYDDNSQLTSWTDTAPSSTITASYTYWDDGSISSITGGGKTTNYTYDAADRVIGAGGTAFTYDAAGNRKTASGGGTTVTYNYNGSGWVTSAVGVGYTWTYDNVGNVLTLSGGGESATNTYNGNYLITQSVNGSQTTTTNSDRSGRTLSTVVYDSSANDGDGATYTYSYNYNSDGLQTSVVGSGTGDATGSSTSSYNVNGDLIQVNLGKGDSQDSAEINTFVYDNEGRIISARARDGEGGDTTTHYLYALGYPVGEYTDAASPTVNEGDYATVRTISTGFEGQPSAFPEPTVIQHTVQVGDTLRSLAAQYYGSPDLWFVIAEANGLGAEQALQIGSRLVVPTTVENAFHNADTHALYKEGDIIGSKLPNLSSPPPPDNDGDKCAVVAAIILIVVVAIVAIAVTILTVGAAAPAAAAALGLTAGSVGAILVGVAVGAVIGAAIAFVASVTTQGILVGFGLQEEFDWKAVAADTVAGALGGAAAGLGAAVNAARAATTAIKVVNVVGQIALETAGEAASQAIQNDGQIDNPWLVVVAGVGASFGAVSDLGTRALKVSKAAKAAADAAEVASDAAVAGSKTVAIASDAVKSVDEIADAARAANKNVFAAVFKAQWSATAQPFVKTVKGLGKGVAGLSVAGAKQIGKGLVAVGRGGGKGLGAIYSGGAAAVKAVSKGGAVYEGVVSAGQAIGRATSKAGQAISEFVQRGTVFEGKITKTVRYFESVDGVRVAKYKQVFKKSTRTVVKGTQTKIIRSIDESGNLRYLQVVRDSVARKARVKNAFIDAGRAVDDGIVSGLDAAARGWNKLIEAGGRGADAAARALDSAQEAFGRAQSKATQAIFEFRQKGTVFKGNITKTVRYFDTVDGQRVAKYKQVIRESARTVAKGKQSKIIRTIDDGGQLRLVQVLRDSTARKQRLVSALEAGATRTQDAFSAAGAALERLPGKVLNATRNVGEGAWGAVRKTFTSPAFYSWGGYFGQKGTTVAEAMVRDTLFDPRKTRIRFSKRLNWNFWASNKLYTLVSPVGVAIVGRDNSIAAARTIGGAFGGSSLEAKLGAWAEVVPEVRDAFVTKPSPPAEPIDDLNANTTFADLHNRQHSWLALDWTSVAATTTTRVFSPFGIDRSGSAAQSLSSDKMVAGQVFEFDDETLLAFAERSVGGVGGDVTTMPNQVS